MTGVNGCSGGAMQLVVLCLPDASDPGLFMVLKVPCAPK